MSNEPSFPAEAAVGDPAAMPAVAKGGETLGIATSAKHTKQSAEAAHASAPRTRTLIAGAAVGVGSAALVAALLYASRSRRADPRPSAASPPASVPPLPEAPAPAPPGEAAA